METRSSKAKKEEKEDTKSESTDSEFLEVSRTKEEVTIEQQQNETVVERQAQNETAGQEQPQPSTSSINLINDEINKYAANLEKLQRIYVNIGLSPEIAAQIAIDQLQREQQNQQLEKPRQLEQKKLEAAEKQRQHYRDLKTLDRTQAEAAHNAKMKLEHLKLRSK